MLLRTDHLRSLVSYLVDCFRSDYFYTTIIQHGDAPFILKWAVLFAGIAVGTAMLYVLEGGQNSMVIVETVAVVSYSLSVVLFFIIHPILKVGSLLWRRKHGFSA
jgi:hypothetical protein